jgi:DNA helicase-2/ATP-dependent DNA helicase PcrA
MVLRPAQRKILEYHGGRMAVSAVPGSGKTFTLSMLASELIRSGRVDTSNGQQVLIVTYLNASVDTFRSRIRQRLEEHQLPLTGYEVRTLHSLALEIVRASTGGSLESDDSVAVLDEPQTLNLLAHATDKWIEANPGLWQELLADDRPQSRVRWRDLIASTARIFIREAKNHRYTPAAIWRQIGRQVDSAKNPASGADAILSSTVGELIGLGDQFGLLIIMVGIYERYQAILTRQGASDFDDLIWQATDLLANRPDVASEFRRRWPYVLEDEAQDSVPMQESLLTSLAGPEGNWVRVGDPNQAITSTFTSAHPRHFSDFMKRPDVKTLPLPNSGRCAPLIYNAANLLVNWVVDHHPVPEVRSDAFRRQEILPTPQGDVQINPPDSEADFFIKVFSHRETEELPAIAELATRYAAQHQNHTVAILIPTNNLGHELATRLDDLSAPYDNLLRGGTKIREIAAALRWLLQLMANPLDGRALEAIYASLLDLEHTVVQSEQHPDHDRVRVLLRSVHRPELLLYAEDDVERVAALPAGIVSDHEQETICRFARFVSRLFQYRPLPIDDMILSLSDELFSDDGSRDGGSQEAELAVAYQLASAVRQWWDLQPEWRLPELAAQLADVAEGRRRLYVSGPGDAGFEPKPGRITLATQHGAKGMEWDAVFLVGIDGRWVPGDLDGHFLGVDPMVGGDPAAELSAQLHTVMKGDDGLYPGRTATESAHIEVISERLRLLYVGITRARRFLHISRSRQATRRQKDYDTEPATVLGVLYRYLTQTSVRS